MRTIVTAALFSSLLAACSSGGLQVIGSDDAGRAVADASVNADGSSMKTATDASVVDASTKTDATCSKATQEADACSSEGAFCNPSPCTDQCQFCNSLRCADGKWSRMEAFPMPQSFCASVACGSATCGKGEYCVRSHSGPQPIDGGSGVSYECGNLPSGCTDCACAKAATPSCASTSCTPDTQTQKPLVDCYYQ